MIIFIFYKSGLSQTQNYLLAMFFARFFSLSCFASFNRQVKCVVTYFSHIQRQFFLQAVHCGFALADEVTRQERQVIIRERKKERKRERERKKHFTLSLVLLSLVKDNKKRGCCIQVYWAQSALLSPQEYIYGSDGNLRLFSPQFASINVLFDLLPYACGPRHLNSFFLSGRIGLYEHKAVYR